MSQPVSLIMLEFLAWVASRPRSYAEAMDAWRSTCPRHTVWEDAIIDDLIQVGSNGANGPAEVALTARGRAILEANHSSKLIHD